MIDLKLLRSEPDLVRESQRSRGEDEGIVDEALAADAEHRAALTEFEARRAEQKSLGKMVAKAKGEDKAAVLELAKALAAEVKALEATANAAGDRAVESSRALSNIVAPGVPAGGEADFVTLREVGARRDFEGDGITVRDHLEIGDRRCR